MRSDYCSAANEPCQLVCLDGCVFNKATPPKREWQGLTDEDLHQIILAAVGVAEAKLKDKNT